MAVDWNILGKHFGLKSPIPKEHRIEANRLRGENLGALSTCRSLCKKHPDIQMDKDTSGGWWVTCPSLPVDPYDGGNFCATGIEALEMVRDYVRILQEQR